VLEESEVVVEGGGNFAKGLDFVVIGSVKRGGA
jgi:hypothetical protein